MPKLWVGKLVQTPRGGHTKIAPDIFGAAKVELLHGARAGLETFVGIFAGDAARDHVAFRVGNGERVDEIDWIARPRLEGQGKNELYRY